MNFLPFICVLTVVLNFKKNLNFFKIKKKILDFFKNFFWIF